MILLDAHVHVYPFYDLARFLDAAVANMPFPAPGDELRDLALERSKADDFPNRPLFRRVLALAERHDCHFFRDLLAGGVPLPPPWRVSEAFPDGVTVVRGDLPDAPALTFLPGRQIVPRERIELCAFGADAPVPDGLSADETFDAILAADAIPLLNWAPGKWLFKRARVISRLLEHRRPLVLADTSLRPLGWPTPLAFRRARRLGIPVLAGSDPLPVPGEESLVGSCHARCAAVGFANDPKGVAAAVCKEAVGAPLVLRRPSPFALRRRLAAHKRASAGA